VLEPQERISLDAAIRMFTADATSACHLDDRGVLATDKLGDLLVLSTGPWLTDSSTPGVEVHEVWIGAVLYAGQDRLRARIGCRLGPAGG
jgi:imidazolonepropionase-like amidohydrolase